MTLRQPSFHHAAFGLTCVYGLLVFCQLTTTTGEFASDLQMHVAFVIYPGSNPAAGYSLLHQLCGWMLAWTGLKGSPTVPFVSAAMATALAAVHYASLVVVHDYFRRTHPARSEWIVSGCALAVFLVSMIIAVKGLRYLGVFTPNPWHNPTYSFGRFFSILAFLQFVRLLEPGARPSAGAMGWLAVTAALSAWGKPSFLIAFLPAAGVMLAWGGWRRWFGLGHMAAAAAAFVPAVLIIAWIDHKVFAPGAAGGSVVIDPGTGWSVYASNITLSIGLGMAFPLFVLAARCRRLSRTTLTAALTWAASTGAFLLLAETGPRAAHANFAWCYMSGMFFLHLAAIEEWFLRDPADGRIVRWIGLALFAAHLLSGVVYLAGLLAGGPYT